MRYDIEMKPTLLATVLALLLACPGVARAADEPASPVEDLAPLDVAIDGQDYALDSLIVRLPGENRLPVALIAHGAIQGDGEHADIGVLSGWAHDLAQRGWLAVVVMRRGYGGSEGALADDPGEYDSPDAARLLEAQADDLEAALRSIGRRPDADMGRVLAVGESTGGAVLLALAARPSVKLSAVVSVSGGLACSAPFVRDPRCAQLDADLVWNFARFGATARMPTLWLYPENDSLFRPGLVQRMHAAFTGTGGRAELAMLPPFGDDGRALFYDPVGMRLLLPRLDRFLRANGLPTWDEAASQPLIARLPPGDGQAVRDYLRLLTAEKALALAPGGGASWRSHEDTAADARDGAGGDCQGRAGRAGLAFDNFRPLIEAPP